MHASTARAAALSAVLVALAACGPSTSGDDDQSCEATGSCDAGTVTEMCTPGTVEACYSGPVGTQGVGPCQGGTRTCGSNGVFGACEGQVVPVGEICGNGIDDNCNTMTDEVVDADADGFTTCDGDCCDSTADGCTLPALVNPGAFEAAANMLDDDCDGTVDNVVAATCDTGLASNSGTGLDYAKALDLCQTATENPGDTRWGVISATLTMPNGSGIPNANQRSIRPSFGATTVQAGSSFVVLSTGHAAATGQTAPGFQPFQGGVVHGTTSPVPVDWLGANGGNFPNAPGCPDPQGGSIANDPVMLTLRVRAPTNARSFTLRSNFFSSEYPEWVCSPYNDFFVVLLDSTWTGTPANPADKNLAFYTAPGGAKYPVGVNLAFGNTGLFTQCLNGPTGCGGGSVAGNTNTCTSTALLSGTGMDVVNPPSQFPGDPGVCGASNLAGGGTGWLATSGNVVGGEIITLRLALWDTGDAFYDSVVVIDGFEWSVDAAEPGTVVD